MEHKCQDVQFVLNALAEACWSELAAEGDLLLEDDHFALFTADGWATVSPIDSVLAKIHPAKTNVFSDSFLCLGESSIYDLQENFEGLTAAGDDPTAHRRLSTTSARNAFVRPPPHHLHCDDA